MSFIEVSKVSMQYKNKTALNGISFSLERGEVLVVSGDNGAGKSTLLSILATLLRPTSGHVFFNDADIVKSPRTARDIMSYVPQETALQTQLSLRDNLDFWAHMNGLKKDERERINQYVISLLDLEPYLKIKVNKLSGGIKRRANIAAALYNEPQILLMDEATVGIDTDSRKKILEFVLAKKESGAAVIYVTHITDEIRYLNDKLLRLNNGCVEFLGKVSECPIWPTFIMK